MRNLRRAIALVTIMVGLFGSAGWADKVVVDPNAPGARAKVVSEGVDPRL